MINRSIGAQITILFAKNGASALLLCDVAQSALDAVHDALRLNGPFPDCRLISRVLDVSDEGQVAAAISQLDPLGGVDVLANCAGVFPTAMDGDAISTTAEAWDLTHRVNVLGTWLGCKHAVLSMRRHGKTKGSIINVSSVAGLVGSATSQLAYAASKGAVIALTRELGIVHAKEGYRFNCLCPAPLNNPMLNDFLDGEDEPVQSYVDGSAAADQPQGDQGVKLSRRQRREVHLPQGRFGQTIEVAGAALFLASDMSAFVNSTELVVDGGMTKVCHPAPFIT